MPSPEPPTPTAISPRPSPPCSRLLQQRRHQYPPRPRSPKHKPRRLRQWPRYTTTLPPIHPKSLPARNAPHHDPPVQRRQTESARRWTGRSVYVRGRVSVSEPDGSEQKVMRRHGKLQIVARFLRWHVICSGTIGVLIGHTHCGGGLI